VGAAADQARRAGAKSFFRGHRGGDTGEIDPVPGEDAGQPADPEELRYAPREPRRRRWVQRVLVLLVLAGVLAAAGVLGYRWSQDQYYVAAHGDTVAIWRGVQADIPGLSLTRVAEDTDVTIASLPEYPTEQVASGIPATSLADAHHIVERLTGLARVCPSPSPTASPSAGPSGKPSATSAAKASARSTAKPTASPRAGATGSPRVTASPSASPSAGPSAAASPTLAPPDCIEETP
jgi:protein phosphatase